MLNMIEPGVDRTAKTQLRLQKIARKWSPPRLDGGVRKGASVVGWAAGLSLAGRRPVQGRRRGHPRRGDAGRGPRDAPDRPAGRAARLARPPCLGHERLQGDRRSAARRAAGSRPPSSRTRSTRTAARAPGDGARRPARRCRSRTSVASSCAAGSGSRSGARPTSPASTSSSSPTSSTSGPCVARRSEVGHGRLVVTSSGPRWDDPAGCRRLGSPDDRGNPPSCPGVAHRASTQPSSASPRWPSASCSWRAWRRPALGWANGATSATATARTTGSSARRTRSSATSRRPGSTSRPPSWRPTTRTSSSGPPTSTSSTRRATAAARSTGSPSSTTRRWPRIWPATTRRPRPHSAGWPTTTATSSSRITRTTRRSTSATRTGTTRGLVGTVTRNPDASPEWSTDDRAPKAVADVRPLRHRRGGLFAQVFPELYGLFKVDETVLAPRVAEITGLLLKRASSDLADLLYSIDQGVGEAAPVAFGQVERPLAIRRQEHDADRLRHGQGSRRAAARGCPCRYRLPEGDRWDEPAASLYDGRRHGHRVWRDRRQPVWPAPVTSVRPSRPARW